jgi:hypothetical protein
VPQGIGKASWTNTSAAPLPSALRTALAVLIGNVLEWFDFAVYGYFAGDIGHLFFPQSSPAAQPLLAFAVFALGFFARPVGSHSNKRVAKGGFRPIRIPRNSRNGFGAP